LAACLNTSTAASGVTGRWYEDERAEVAEHFFSDVDRTFARIRERPLQFPTVSAEVR
jgi:hypothetical protein